MSTINKAAASMQTPADYTPRKEDFALLEQHDIATDKNFASQGYWKGVAIHFFRNKRAVTGLVIVLLIVFFAVFGPMMSRYGYKDIVSITTKVNGRNRQITAGGLAPRIPWLHKLLGGEAYEDQFADRTFIFGTDDMGRDLWTRTWHGARVSLLIAFITILIDMIVGMSYGLVSGYFGGVTDNIMQRFVEVANSVPRLVIVSVLAIFMKKGMGLVIVALLLTEWIGMSKIARAEMLPNIIGPIITQVMFSIPTAIFTEAFLSFVGVGIVLPQCSVGTLIEDGFNNITTLPYQILPPILVLALLMLGFNFIGDGLREALAPKLEDM